jgi:hypothetical protein
MKSTLLTLFVVLIFLSFLPVKPEAAEKHPSLRQSWYIGAGVGWGNADGDFTLVSEIDRQNGIIGCFRLGYAWNDRWALGLEAAVWDKTFEESNVKWTLATIALAATYYVPNTGVYVRFGVGLGSSFFEQDQAVGGRQAQDTSGLELLGAVGYEWRVHRNVALGPQVEYVYIDMNSDFTLNADLFAVTGQVTYYW